MDVTPRRCVIHVLFIDNLVVCLLGYLFTGPSQVTVPLWVRYEFHGFLDSLHRTGEKVVEEKETLRGMGCRNDERRPWVVKPTKGSGNFGRKGVSNSRH